MQGSGSKVRKEKMSLCDKLKLKGIRKFEFVAKAQFLCWDKNSRYDVDIGYSGSVILLQVAKNYVRNPISYSGTLSRFHFTSSSLHLVKCSNITVQNLRQ